jgi:hypothetical protein
MKRFRLLSRLLSAGMLSAMLGTLAAQVAQAQSSIALLKLCMIRSGTFSVGSRDISVNGYLYISTLQIHPNTALTCRLPGGPASLLLEFAIPDTENYPPVKINVYVNGYQVASRIGDRGKVHTMLVDISNGKSLVVEVFCATSCDPIGIEYHFIKAQIDPRIRAPRSR